jgi:lysozyme family protein
MNFDDAFERVIGHEGGYVNDPLDPGGETRYGISRRAYPGEDIARMTLDRAKAIYRRDYWGAAGCDAVPDMLKYPLFDAAVNQGVGRAVRMLQHAVHESEDGVLGPRTLQAIGSVDSARIAFRFMAARLVAYAETPEPQWQRFGRGWIRRMAGVMEA